VCNERQRCRPHRCLLRHTLLFLFFGLAVVLLSLGSRPRPLEAGVDKTTTVLRRVGRACRAGRRMTSGMTKVHAMGTLWMPWMHWDVAGDCDCDCVGWGDEQKKSKNPLAPTESTVPKPQTDARPCQATPASVLTTPDPNHVCRGGCDVHAMSISRCADAMTRPKWGWGWGCAPKVEASTRLDEDCRSVGTTIAD
jgi:hypothetical protein